MPQIEVPGQGVATYSEIPEGSPVYTLANGTTRVDRTFRVDWDKRELFCRGVLGFPKIKNTKDDPDAADNVAYITRFNPQAMPNFKDPTGSENWLYAVGVSRMVGAGPRGVYDDSGVARYQYALVTVQYESLTYKVLEDDELIATAESAGYPNVLPIADESTLLRYVTRVTKPSAEYITLPRGIMYWFLPGASPMPKVDFANARLVPSQEITYTWHQVPFQPAAATSHIGSVNLLPFRDSNKTYNPGTLLLLSAEMKPYRTAVGAFVNDVTYRMKYFEPQPGRGHNFFLRYNKSTSSLSYVKLTSREANDSLAIGTSPEELDAPGTGPYTASQGPGASTGVYPYKDFRELFLLKALPS